MEADKLIEWANVKISEAHGNWGNASYHQGFKDAMNDLIRFRGLELARSAPETTASPSENGSRQGYFNRGRTKGKRKGTLSTLSLWNHVRSNKR